MKNYFTNYLGSVKVGRNTIIAIAVTIIEALLFGLLLLLGIFSLFDGSH